MEEILTPTHVCNINNQEGRERGRGRVRGWVVIFFYLFFSSSGSFVCVKSVCVVGCFHIFLVWACANQTRFVFAACREFGGIK